MIIFCLVHNVLVTLGIRTRRPTSYLAGSLSSSSSSTMRQPIMSAFIYHLQNSFYPTPNVEELVFVNDFWEWLDPFLHLQFKTMTGPHRFIFHQDGSNPLWPYVDAGVVRSADVDTRSFFASLPTGPPRVLPFRPLRFKAKSTTPWTSRCSNLQSFLRSLGNQSPCGHGRRDRPSPPIGKMSSA